MAANVQVAFDCADPAGLGRFWAAALGYIEQPVPPGYESWDALLAEMGVPEDKREDAYAVVDPDGAGPRLFFQKVPEGKSAKNRVHLDICPAGVTASADERRVAAEGRRAELVEVGAREVTRLEEYGQFWIVMQDPEGNEFCLH